MITLDVHAVAKTSVCTSREDGLRLYYEIDKALKSGEDVSLDFSSVKEVISGFLNPAIGSLYGSYDEPTILSRVKFVNTTEDQKETIKLVLKWAKKYYKNKSKREQIIQDYMKDEGSDDL